MSAFNRLCKKLNYVFNDKNLLAMALTHRSVGKSNNERLEYLGDSILNFVVAEELYKRFVDAREGDLSRLRSWLVNGDRLAEIAQALNLGEFLALGPGELKTGGHRRASILEDALEAIIGAVYLDSDFILCRKFILSLYTHKLQDIPTVDELKDPKTRLQEYLQARKAPLPDYAVDDISGEQHSRIFKVSCTVTGLKSPTFGIGGSRRKAEQESAKQALDALLNRH
ncbi:Ribonuclease III [hydrothermal vent metagenome]|uniref:ribonuclease III n=1 Tax=hydrothermal vent metagenome TaxID=652676 RepID=A0A3B0ZIL1_9ZZZZ